MLLTLFLRSLLLRMFYPRNFPLVKAGEILFASSEVKGNFFRRDFFDFALLRWWRHDCTIEDVGSFVAARTIVVVNGGWGSWKLSQLGTGQGPLTGNFGGDSTARVASDKCGATQGSLESFILTEQRCFKDSMDRLT